MLGVQTEKNNDEHFFRLDSSFKYRVLKASSGETLKICYQCGTCTATCPVALFTELRPNKMIHMAKLGIQDFLKNNSLWLCSACYTCTERCPQGIEVKDIIRIFKNLAIEEGLIPDFYKDLYKIIIETGLAYNISESRLKRRENQGLPPIPKTKIEDIKKIAGITGLPINKRK